jgi:hypothetical protein
VTEAAAREQITLARRFVERLRELPPDVLAPAVPPLLNRDPYLSAWTNVEAALGNAPPPERERLQVAAQQLDAELAELALAPRCTRRRAGQYARCLRGRGWRSRKALRWSTSRSRPRCR